MRLGVPDLVTNSYFPAIAAVELGFFRAEGLEVEIEHLFPITRTMAALRDGSLDFVAGSAHDALAVFPGWKGARLLAALSQRMYWLLVLRTGLGASRGELAALKGCRIAAAPGPAAGLERLLVAGGLDKERDGIEIGPLQGPLPAGASFGVAAAAALAAGEIDGFWANAMAAEVAVRSGVGTVILDVRRGDGPPAAWNYTFPALITTERLIDANPDAVASAVRAIVKVQRALRTRPTLAGEAVSGLFPPDEAMLISDLIARDGPYLDPTISPETVASMTRFAADIGLLTTPVAYEQVVASEFTALWPG
jgi:ABC-type nitrate/sulfonate/bicarbonate transport system substrate-binding protein